MLTRGQLLVAALHVAAHLKETTESDTVALLLPTSAATPIAALAAWMIGKTVVPLNYLLKPEELSYVIADCGADTVVTTQAMLDFMGSTADECLYAPKGGGGGAPPVKHLIRIEDIGFSGVPEMHWPAVTPDEAVALLLYTSGTTGKPKGVMLTHGNITANIRQIVEHVDFSDRDSLLGVLPQFHSFGMTALTLLPLTVGCKVVYTARFVPSRLVKLLREHRPTCMIAVPSMYNAMLHVKDAEPADFASLRYTVSGGEPLPVAVAEGFKARFHVTLNEGFGMTETGPATNWCRPFEARPRSVGKAMPRVCQRIVDVATERDVPIGQEGELRIAGPNVTPGYYRLPELTAALFDSRGYLRSGDIAKFDHDGHLYITGRIKEMLIIAGENVFPREIEEVLNRHPSVKDSGVIGMADPLRGEVPVAFVEMKEAAGEEAGAETKVPFDELAILSWCREHLAGYKVPAEVRCVDTLPRTATGKVSRKDLKALVNPPA
ncbi:MAG: AMP-binding protein [Phycisphaeraceae bacterium]|nr:AMP-binding protein [Phycisphaeraceae bacterium]